MRPDLPTGTITFLFTDVEGSTKLLEEIGDEAYDAALAEHRQIVRAACAEQGGVEVDTQGDAFFFAFPTAPGALAAASAMRDALAPGPIQVRIGLHTGRPRITDEGYVGKEVHFAARVAATGHGGQIVLSKATADLVEADLTELGEQRLKDVPEAVPIYQLGSGSFPPLKTISNTNLPRPASSFVGREAELAQVLARIEQGARLLTLTGPGGSGKTRLALEAASRLVPEYKAGVFWVGLAALRDSALVAETISQTLGAKEGLTEHIGEREMMLLLDNLEQVIETAPELASLLEACPNLTLVCTSRELLRVRGEVEYPVLPLASPEAVSLFCERAQLHPSGEIAELCAQLDNLPLAVELAAARTKALSPKEILERISQRLDLLKGGRDADPRQQTLRATIEWSYDLLSEEEKRLFQALSVFAGGCTLEAAAEVADADLDTLQSLVEKSLVRYSNERYWMLETIREFAAGHLEGSGELESLRGRHASYFTAAAEARHAEWMYGKEIRSPYRWFRTEQANLRNAVEWAAVDVELQLRLLHAARIHRTFSGRERRRWLESALARLGDKLSLEHARALANAAEAAMDMDDHEGALRFHERALALYRSLDDGEGTARSLVGRGWDLWQLGRAVEARASFDEALTTARRAEATPVIQGASNSLATISLIEGDFSAALRFAAEAQEAGDSSRMYSGRVIGLVELRKGNAAEAVRILSDALESQYEFGYEPLLPATLDALAAALLATGHVERAAVLIGQSSGLRDAMGFAPDLFFRGLREEVASAGRRQLGEDGYRVAVARGEAMSVDEAVENALASRD